jgi:hypothetical protein
MIGARAETHGIVEVQKRETTKLFCRGSASSVQVSRQKQMLHGTRVLALYTTQKVHFRIRDVLVLLIDINVILCESWRSREQMFCDTFDKQMPEYVMHFPLQILHTVKTLANKSSTHVAQCTLVHAKTSTVNSSLCDREYDSAMYHAALRSK